MTSFSISEKANNQTSSDVDCGGGGGVVVSKLYRGYWAWEKLLSNFVLSGSGICEIKYGSITVDDTEI